MRRMLAILLLMLMFGSVSAIPAQAKTFKNCSDLRKVYKYGISLSVKAVNRGAGPIFAPRVSPEIFRLNKRLDLDKDNMVCEVKKPATSAPWQPPFSDLTLTPFPTITGVARVGNTLIAVPGTWDSGVTLSYQWLRNGFPIAGETANTYTLKPEDGGTNTSVEVTGSKSGFYSAVRTGGSMRIPIPTGPVPSATPTLVPTPVPSATPTQVPTPVPSATPTPNPNLNAVPTITGTAIVGSTLTGDPGYWESGFSLAPFLWRRNGQVIFGFFGRNYTLVAADAGTSITFEVTGIKIGSNPEVRDTRISSAVNVPVPTAPTPTPTATPTPTPTPTPSATPAPTPVLKFVTVRSSGAAYCQNVRPGSSFVSGGVVIPASNRRGLRADEYSANFVRSFSGGYSSGGRLEIWVRADFFSRWELISSGSWTAMVEVTCSYYE